MLKQTVALLPSLALLAFASLTEGAHAVTLTFDDLGLSHGSIVDAQYAGVTISANNLGGGPDLAVAFDSNRDDTRDDDLEFGGGWAGGNLAPDTRLGNVIIIQENSTGCLIDDICDLPDDEGSRPAGSLIFEFDVAATSFGFDLVDMEGFNAEDGSIKFFDGATSLEIGMMDFLAGFDLGDNTANRVAPFLVAELDGISQITRVELMLGGSAAIDNVTFQPVPEPSTAALLALGVAALGVRARSRR